MLENSLFPMISNLYPKLKVFYETMVKKVETKDDKIVSLTAIQRFVRNNISCKGYDVFPSEDIPDWYSYEDSSRFVKKILLFKHFKVIIDATDWGEILALSNAPYLQGIDERYDVSFLKKICYKNFNIFFAIKKKGDVVCIIFFFFDYLFEK